MFSDAFCRDFLQEVDGYMDSGLPIRRPNSMNNYGLIVNEIGMLNVISELQREVLWPIARSLWPKEGSAFHAHHSFMVQYRKTEDPGSTCTRTTATSPSTSASAKSSRARG
ncbi:procollagen-lysine 5-dioxygenase [Aureococcus anophagefferens]|nr:procollagen-lysine 5-dioxygenase [Aureococcus anophagefferens]